MNIQERIKQACDEIGDVEYQRYSGRGMYGDQCVGIVGSWRNCMNVIGFVIKAHNDELFGAEDDVSFEEFNTNVDMLMDFRSDQMGRSDVVVYWPDIEYVKLSSDDGDDE